jgi:lipopolysaccharide biosynthesis protein
MNDQDHKVRILAFYLPQFHPIPENDEWWGNGFTEWTNVAKARPLFKGHVQPHIPADLGFYDLRLPEVREHQARLAKDHGIDGFCYWHYWFGNGKQLLERPFREVLKSGRPDFPFCLAWANQSWTGIWHGSKDRILIEQTYPGMQDYEDHFHNCLEAFHDPRYIRIGKKPLFVVYSPQLMPDARIFTRTWNELAIKNGFDGIYFTGIHYLGWDHRNDGFDAKTIHQPSHYLRAYEQNILHKIRGIVNRRINKRVPLIIDYQKAVRHYDFNVYKNKDCIPTIIPNWDNTPRSGKKGWVFRNSTPGVFKTHFSNALDFVMKNPSESGLLFIKSWNEWAEGNYLEPDLQWGHQYLEAIRDVLVEKNMLR